MATFAGIGWDGGLLAGSELCRLTLFVGFGFMHSGDWLIDDCLGVAC